MTDFGRTIGDARKNRMHDADGWNTGPDAETVPMTPDRLAEIAVEAERDAARAELRALRERIAGLADRKSHCSRAECQQLRQELRALLDPAPPVADSEGGERDE